MSWKVFLFIGVSFLTILSLITLFISYQSIEETKIINPPTNLQKAFTRNLIKDMPQEQAEIIINEEVFQIPDEYRVYPEAKGIIIKSEVKG